MSLCSNPSCCACLAGPSCPHPLELPCPFPADLVEAGKAPARCPFPLESPLQAHGPLWTPGHGALYLSSGKGTFLCIADPCAYLQSPW